MAPGLGRQMGGTITNAVETGAVVGAGAGAVVAAAAAYGIAGVPGLAAAAALPFAPQAKKVFDAEVKTTEEGFKHAREVIGKGDEGSRILNWALNLTKWVNGAIAVPGQAIAEVGVNYVGKPLYKGYKYGLQKINLLDQMVMNASAFDGEGFGHFNGINNAYDDVFLWGMGMDSFTDRNGTLQLRFSEFKNPNGLKQTFQNELSGILDPVKRDIRLGELAVTFLNSQLELAFDDKKSYDWLMKLVKDKNPNGYQVRYNAMLRAVIDRFIRIFGQTKNDIVLLVDPIPDRYLDLAEPVTVDFNRKLKDYRNANFAPMNMDVTAFGLGTFNTDANTWVDGANAPIFANGIADIRTELGLSPDGGTFVGGRPLSPVETYKQTLYPRIMDMFRHQPGFPTHDPMLVIVERELERLLYTIIMEQADPMFVLRDKYGAREDGAANWVASSRNEKINTMVAKGRDAAALERPWFIYMSESARKAYKKLTTPFGDTKPENVTRPSGELMNTLLGVPPGTVNRRGQAVASGYDVRAAWTDIRKNLRNLATNIQNNMNGRPEQAEAQNLLNAISRAYVLSIIEYLGEEEGAPAGLSNRLYTLAGNLTNLPDPWLRQGGNAPDLDLEREAILYIANNFPPLPANPTAQERQRNDILLSLLEVFDFQNQLVIVRAEEAATPILNQLAVDVPNRHHAFTNDLAANWAAINTEATAIDNELIALGGIAAGTPAYAAAADDLRDRRDDLLALIDLRAHFAQVANLRNDFNQIDQAHIFYPPRPAELALARNSLNALERDVLVYYQRVLNVDALP